MTLSVQEIAAEQWKDIKGYEGRYMVSDMGRILSIRQFRPERSAPPVIGTKYLNPSYDPSHGSRVSLGKDNNGAKSKNNRLARFVAEAFVPNPDNLANVCFKNGNNADCRASNLLWNKNGVVSRKTKQELVNNPIPGANDPAGTIRPTDIFAVVGKSVPVK